MTTFVIKFFYEIQESVRSSSIVARRAGVDGSDLAETTGLHGRSAASRERDRAEPITRSTLQTQLTRLETKGWLLSDDKGRARLYRSALTEKGGRGKVLAELKHRFFGGSGLSLVRCLVEDGGLTDSEMTELNQLIETHRKGTRP